MVLFEKYAKDYARYRPGYPSNLIDHLINSLKINNSSRILDLACGTGKLSESLGDNISPSIVSADRSLVLLNQNKSPSRLNTIAEILPFKDRSFEAVLIAQAFHWFDFAKALDEIHRILRDGGGFAIIWYRRIRPLEGHRLEMDNLLKAIYPAFKIVFMDYDWADIIKKHRGFTQINEFETVHTWDYSRDDYLKLQRSKSYVGDALSQKQLDNFMQKYGEILDQKFPEGIVKETLEYFYVSALKA